MSVSTIFHKGKKVIYIDYSTATSEEEALATLYQLSDLVKNSPDQILKLNNVSGSFATPKFMSESKRLNKELIGAKTKKGAIIGINSLQEILLRSFNLFARQKLVAFRTKEEALNYLTA